MNTLLSINVVHSTSHWIVPRFVILLLVILGVLILVTEGLGRRKEGKSFIGKPGRFFVENYDKMKFWGTLVLFALYVIVMDLIGFLPASIFFVLLFNLLYCGLKSIKSVLTSACISVVSSTLVWYLFGVMFNITLPRASLF